MNVLWTLYMNTLFIRGHPKYQTSSLSFVSVYPFSLKNHFFPQWMEEPLWWLQTTETTSNDTILYLSTVELNGATHRWNEKTGNNHKITCCWGTPPIISQTTYLQQDKSVTFSFLRYYLCCLFKGQKLSFWSVNNPKKIRGIYKCQDDLKRVIWYLLQGNSLFLFSLHG